MPDKNQTTTSPGQNTTKNKASALAAIGLLPRIAGAALTACLFAWMVYSTASIAIKDRLLHRATDRTDVIRTSYETQIGNLHARLAKARSKFLQQQKRHRMRLLALSKRQDVLFRQHAQLETLVRGTADADQPVAEAPGTPSEITANAATKTIATRLDNLNTHQNTLVEELLGGRRERFANLAGLMGRLGAARSKIPSAPSSKPGIGGPFIATSASDFGSRMRLIDLHDQSLNQVKNALRGLPVGFPLPQKRGVTSGFGRRLDPFRKRIAMHSGADLRAARGSPVLATAAGRVIKAGRLKAYGRMVEIRHANGITTRYAHLSRIEVSVGQKVEAFDRIGRVGSTGRSTGPHLHYETRKSGTPVDPLPYLRAGRHVYKTKKPGSGEPGTQTHNQ